MRPIVRPATLAACLSLAFGQPAAAQSSPPGATREAPEPPTGRKAKPTVTAKRYMVAAANPHAVRAGLEILKAGGGAIDAAIAVQLALNLAEPQSSGIGGGAFMLYWDAATRRLTTYDGRETAAAADGPNIFARFVGPGGRTINFRTAVRTGTAVGVPGVLALLARAHRQHGRLPWARTFEPGIRLAEAGFRISRRLHLQIGGTPTLRLRRATRAYFFASDGKPLPVGYLRRNPAFARTLRAIAANGPRWFYRGPIARDIVRAVRTAQPHPGSMSLADLGAYRALERPPVCGDYRGYKVCGMGAPSSGGIALIQMLGQLQRFDLAKFKPGSVDAAHLLAETGRLAFADRNRWVGDPDFVRVPVRAMLDPAYLAGRGDLIRLDKSMGVAKPGRLPRIRGAVPPAGRALEIPSTSHFSIVDAQGNIVSMTTTIENGFGAQMMVGGFLLNNQMTDFSFVGSVRGRPVANRVEGGKRPRSSMSPTIVFRPDGSPFLVIGSPGGSSIIGYVLRAVTGVIDWKLPLDRALALPHVVNRNGPTDLEAGMVEAGLAKALKARGHVVRVRGLNSGLHGILIRDDGTMVGAADPRREGIAAGE